MSGLEPYHVYLSHPPLWIPPAADEEPDQEVETGVPIQGFAEVLLLPLIHKSAVMKDAKKQIAYGVIKLVVEALVSMAMERANKLPTALERANKIPGAFHGIIKNGGGGAYLCPYGDSHRFSHEADMILHIATAHPHTEVGKSLKERVIIN